MISVNEQRRVRKSKGVRGYYAYAKLMRTLLEGPATSKALSEKHGFKRQAVPELMRRLHHLKVVHIGDWERIPQRGCGWREVWALGEGADAPRPLRCDGLKSLRPPFKLGFRSQVFNFGQLMLALRDGHTVLSMRDLTGIERHCLDDLLQFMRKLRLIHIPEWYRNTSGSPSPVFKLGDKRNEPRPKPLGKTSARAQAYPDERRRREEWRSLLHMTAAPLQASAHI